MGAAQVLAGHWRDIEVPDRVWSVPTMLSPDETRLLYALALGAGDSGRVVDAGCFLGGSTVALAQGLRDSGSAARVDVYDRFTAEKYTLAEPWFDGTDVTRPGDSFRRLFDANLAGLEDLLTVHEGDITRQQFTGPIGLLFLDVLKTWTVHDVVLERTFPLLPVGAVVVHQDYWCGTLPWIQVAMEELRDYFEQVDDVGGSRVYLVTRPIGPEAVERCKRGAITGARITELFERLVDREPDRTRRGLLLLNEAQMSMRAVRSRRYRQIMATLAADWGDDEVVTAAAKQVDGWVFPGAGLLADVLRPTGVLYR